MSDFVFEEIDECEIVGKVRGSGKQKLPEWEPILSWGRGDVSQLLIRRGYCQPNEQDFEEMTKQKEEAMRKQNVIIDEMIALRGIRIKNIKAVRNQKEVRIKL